MAAIRSVPAERCVNCGEGHLTEAAAECVEAIAEELRAVAVELAVREYEAAAQRNRLVHGWCGRGP